MSDGKQMTAWLMEIAIGGILLCFCLFLLWGGHGESLLKRGSETLLSSSGTASSLEGLNVRLEEILRYPSPQLRAEQLTAEAGKTVLLWQKLLVREKSGGWIPLAQQNEITGQILAFYDGQGRRITPVQWQEDNIWEEIPSSVAYTAKKGELIFFRGGCYRVAVRLINQYGRRTEALVTLLVEADVTV